MYQAGDGSPVLSFWKLRGQGCSNRGNSSITYILYVLQYIFQDISSIMPNWIDQASKILHVTETIFWGINLLCFHTFCVGNDAHAKPSSQCLGMDIFTETVAQFDSLPVPIETPKRSRSNPTIASAGSATPREFLWWKPNWDNILVTLSSLPQC